MSLKMLAFHLPNGETECIINSAAIAMVVPTHKTLKITLVTGHEVIVLGDLDTLGKQLR